MSQMATIDPPVAGESGEDIPNNAPLFTAPPEGPLARSKRNLVVGCSVVLVCFLALLLVLAFSLHGRSGRYTSTDVIVNIGYSSTTQRCAYVFSDLSCDRDAGNKGNRVNTDYSSAGDTFEITVRGREVCAKRTDGWGSPGWGMYLEIKCQSAKKVPSDFIAVIGKSDSRLKCVQSVLWLSCEQDAGNRGKRVNNDYSGASDTFDIAVLDHTFGTEVCATRLDHTFGTGFGWDMNLAIKCEVEGFSTIAEKALTKPEADTLIAATI